MSSLTQRPKISVCMSTYCGERFVVEQLKSILVQLGDDDEVIVVDDASTDQTVALVKSIADHRIRLVQQRENRGVIRTFEAALSNATGDIVFLADQDDLWARNKVARFLEVFEAQPEVTLVVSDFAVIDEHGVPQERAYGTRGKFRSGFVANVFRNRYQGSAMAFRAAVLQRSLPFPAKIPMHDSWIGLMNEVFGKTVYLDEPLLLYRRHGANASGEVRRSVGNVLRDRVWLLMGLARRLLKVS